jgi:GDPmannose 4,6-dehydratase
MINKKKVILIIGTGTIGAYLSEYLLRKKYKVVVTSRSLKKNYLNYEKLNITKKINFIKLDVLNKQEIKKSLKIINPSCIYYFAGISSITESFKYPKKTYESNYLGAKNFLEILKKNKSLIKFFKANSAYIFNPKKKKITLKSSLIKPNSPYVSSQIKAFKEIKKYRKFGLNCYSIIFFNIESPIRDKDFFIKKICLGINKIKDSKIKVGNLKSIRDFGWASEIVKAVYLMIKIKPCDLILGTGKGISTRDILKLIFGFKKLNYKDFIIVDRSLLRKNENNFIVSDMKHTFRKLKKWNWKPKIFGKKLIWKMYKTI